MVDEPHTNVHAEDSRGSKARVSIWLLALAALVVAYPLALGPLVYLCQKDALPSWTYDGLMQAYRPLAWADMQSPQLKGALDGYVRWWLGLAREEGDGTQLLFWWQLQFGAGDTGVFNRI